MKALLILAIGIVALSGCATGTSIRQTQYEAGRKSAIEAFNAKLVIPKCDGTGAQCPEMLYKSLVPSVWVKAQNCATLKGSKRDACSSELADMILSAEAKLRLRYPQGDFEETQLKCQAHREYCTDFGQMEFDLMKSHNKKVLTEMKIATGGIDSKYANELVEERRHQELVRAASYTPPAQSFNCTANTIGGTTFANCY